MTIEYHTISEQQLVICDYNVAIENIQTYGLPVWIDVIDAQNADLDQIMDYLNIHGNLRSFCTEANNHPGFYPMQPVGLVVMPVQMEVQDSNHISYLSILISNQYVVTIRDSRMARLKKNMKAEEIFQFLPDSTPVGLISTFMFGLSLDSIRKAAILGDAISEMENRIDKDPLSLNLGELTDRRTEVMSLESIVQGQLPILTIVNTSDRLSNIGEAAKEYQRWALANFQSAEKNLQWLEHRIEVMRSSLDMHAQDAMNKKLGRLTVLSMIFMPITFLAGIWGMNFKDIPLVSQDLGYVWAILIMLAIAGCMYLYFKRKGWFG